MTVFCLSGENRIGEGVSSFLFENVCLGMGVDPWVFALYLFLGFCFVVGIFFCDYFSICFAFPILVLV